MFIVAVGRRRADTRVVPPLFNVVFLGYDRHQVDELLERIDRALSSGSEVQRARARQDLRSVTLHRRLRGYRKRQVLRLLDARSHELAS